MGPDDLWLGFYNLGPHTDFPSSDINVVVSVLKTVNSCWVAGIYLMDKNEVLTRDGEELGSRASEMARQVMVPATKLTS